MSAAELASEASTVEQANECNVITVILPIVRRSDPEGLLVFSRSEFAPSEVDELIGVQNGQEAAILFAFPLCFVEIHSFIDEFEDVSIWPAD